MPSSFRAQPRALLILLVATLYIAVACDDDPNTTVEEDATADVLGDATGTDTGVDAPDQTGVDSVEADTEADVVLDVCGDDVCAEGEFCPEDCALGPVFAWQPLGDDLTAFPDDFQTIDDGSTETGVRVDLDPVRLSALERFPDGLAVFQYMDGLDGFSPTAPIYLGFDAALDGAGLPTEAGSLATDSSVVVGYLDEAGGFVQVPVRVNQTGYRLGLLARVLSPLPAQARVVVMARDTLTGEDGSPVTANAALAGLLAGDAPAGLERLQPRYDEAVAALTAAGVVASTDEIAGLTVFTTRSIHAGPRALAAAVQSEDWTITEIGGCTNVGNAERCDFRFEAPDIRDAEGNVDYSLSSPLPRYVMDGVAYLPASGPSPQGGFPAIIFGHGLGGDRYQAGRATAFVDRGWAMVSLDAPGHGDHPYYEPVEQIEQVLAFFGVDLTTELGIRPLVMEGSFVQGAMDKLALEDALSAGVNLDGNGQNEISAEHLTYVGVSLGGIMAPQYLALSARVEAGVVISGGGRVTDVVADSMIGASLNFALPGSLTPVDGDMLFGYVQTVVDAADGGNWARHVAQDRFDGRPGISLLSAIALEDEVVPNSTSLFLARAFGGDHVAPELLPVLGLDVVGAPLSGNGPEGNTIGFLEFDWINNSGTENGWRRADHQNIAPSTIGIEAWSHFLNTHRDNGLAEVHDPYEALGLTPPR